MRARADLLLRGRRDRVRAARQRSAQQAAWDLPGNAVLGTWLEGRRTHSVSSS